MRTLRESTRGADEFSGASAERVVGCILGHARIPGMEHAERVIAHILGGTRRPAVGRSHAVSGGRPRPGRGRATSRAPGQRGR